MTTKDLIKHIVKNPRREVIVIDDQDDMRPDAAICYLIDNFTMEQEWGYEDEGNSTLLAYTIMNLSHEDQQKFIAWQVKYMNNEAK